MAPTSLSDIVFIWFVVIVMLAFVYAVDIIIHVFRENKKDREHYRGMKRSLIKHATSLAKELSVGK